MRQTFRLKGLNKPWKAGGFGGYYATVEYGKEDWFHCGFDEKYISFERQKALFDMFKNTEENLWADAIHNVNVKFDGYSSGGAPMNPIIKEIYLDLELKIKTLNH